MLGIMLSILVVFGIGGTVANFLLHDRLMSIAQHQMELTSQGITSTVRGLINSSIKNYLKGISETNLAYLGRVYALFQNGQITEAQARSTATDFLLSQKVGDTGYIVALNCTNPEAPVVAIHPNPDLIGEGVERFPFMRDECRLKEGHFEFSVTLPGQEERLKSMWVSWFEPWQWTLGATPFKDEFPKLVDLDGIETELSKVDMQAQGYAFIMDMDGLLLSHPQWKGRNMLDTVDAKTGAPFVREFVGKIRTSANNNIPEGQAGVIQYHIKDPTGQRIYQRMMNYRYVPEMDWIVGVVVDLDDLAAPLMVVRNTQIIVIMVSVAFALLVIGWSVRPVIRSIGELTEAVEKIDGGHLDTPLPVSAKGEVGRLAQSFHRMAKRVARYTEHLEHEVAKRTAELEQANQKLEQLSITDGLTALANRRRFDEKLADECLRAIRTEQPLALALIDVDHFKLYNDRYGHQNGDSCLQNVAKTLSEHTHRTGDLAARYGGEEFAVILVGTDETGAVQQAEKIRASIEALGIPHEGSPFKTVSVSIGVRAHTSGPDLSPEGLIASADEALYRSKSNGRNRVETAP